MLRSMLRSKSQVSPTVVNAYASVLPPDVNGTGLEPPLVADMAGQCMDMSMSKLKSHVLSSVENPYVRELVPDVNGIDLVVLTGPMLGHGMSSSMFRSNSQHVPRVNDHLSSGGLDAYVLP